MQINNSITIDSLTSQLNRFWELSAAKISSVQQNYQGAAGSPVVTVDGTYVPRSWTDWTQGFQFGSAILQFDATGEKNFLESGIRDTREKMASHVSHFGVHDHGFNNQSTYGNLLRLMNEGKFPQQDWEQEFYQLALKLSASVQAKRWTSIPDGGYVYSFNGPHSLFVDTIRTIRVMVLGHILGHHFSEENDVKTNLLERAIQHALTTAKYSIFYGEGRDHYDDWGRTAHEAIFNINDGNFRCPATQQGYSGYSTWTRGLSWAMLGFAEQLEFLHSQPNLPEFDKFGGVEAVKSSFIKAAKATCDFYIHNTAKDGIPYWDTGAPGLAHLPDWREVDSNPFNDFEPVDSSAAAIGAQGLLRLGNYLQQIGDDSFQKYWQAGLTVCKSLLAEPYLSTKENHQGLVLHSIYHRPNGWDHIPEGAKIPSGESCMWGDYHARELALYIQRKVNNEPYLTYFNAIVS